MTSRAAAWAASAQAESVGRASGMGRWVTADQPVEDGAGAAVGAGDEGRAESAVGVLFPGDVGGKAAGAAWGFDGGIGGGYGEVGVAVVGGGDGAAGELWASGGLSIAMVAVSPLDHVAADLLGN